MDNAYAAAVCRYKGVPAFWVDDCIQEIQAEIAMHPDKSERQIAGNTAVDYARKYGPHYRGGNVRYTAIYGLDEAINKPAAGFEAVSDAKLDLQRAWPSLSSSMQRALGLRALGYDAGCTYAYVSQSRKRLREAVS